MCTGIPGDLPALYGTSVHGYRTWVLASFEPVPSCPLLCPYSKVPSVPSSFIAVLLQALSLAIRGAKSDSAASLKELGDPSTMVVTIDLVVFSQLRS